VWSLLGGLDALDLEFDPIAFFKVMDASIEGQQELKPILGRIISHIISCDDITALPHSQREGRL
jgi:hypothetical protein